MNRAALSHRMFVVVHLIAIAGMEIGCVAMREPESGAEVEHDPVDSATAVAALQGTEYGQIFIANAFTSGDQAPASANICANGDSVLALSDFARAGTFARRYSGGGVPLQRAETLVDPSGRPTGEVGCFALVRTAPDGSGFGVYAQVFDRAGNVALPEFRVNDATSGDQVGGQVAINARGQLVVIWRDVPTRAIYAKLFQPSGAAVAPAQLVYAAGLDPFDPHVAINNQGAFAVTWAAMTSPSPNINYDVFARSYGATGFAASPAFLVSTSAAIVQLSPAIAIGPAGDFWIVWDSLLMAGASWQVLGRHFSATGTALSSDIVISTPPAEPNKAIGVADNGNFMMLWDEFDQVSHVSRVRGRTYRPTGVPFGDAFAVSTAESLSNSNPVLALDPDGGAIAAWTQMDPATANKDVAARRFLPSGITVQTIDDGATVAGLSGAAGSWQYFKVTVAPGRTIVDVSIAGAVGDADLYVRYGAVPSATRWDGRPFIDGSNEGVEMVSFPPGDWYIGINGFTAYASLTLQTSSR